jgi:hypothetical protein
MSLVGLRVKLARPVEDEAIALSHIPILEEMDVPSKTAH